MTKEEKETRRKMYNHRMNQLQYQDENRTRKIHQDRIKYLQALRGRLILGRKILLEDNKYLSISARMKDDIDLMFENDIMLHLDQPMTDPNTLDLPFTMPYTNKIFIYDKLLKIITKYYSRTEYLRNNNIKEKNDLYEIILNDYRNQK